MRALENAATVSVALILVACQSPKLSNSYQFNSESDETIGNGQTALIYVYPLQNNTFYRAVDVNLESETRGDNYLQLGNGLAPGSRRLKIERSELSTEAESMLGTSLNYRLSYGIDFVAAGDYAIVEHWGGNYLARCMEDSAPVIRLEPGKINILKDLRRVIYDQVKDTDARLQGDVEFAYYMEEALSQYPGLKGDIHIVEPISIVDFEPASALTAFMVGGCGRHREFLAFPLFEETKEESDKLADESL